MPAGTSTPFHFIVLTEPLAPAPVRSAYAFLLCVLFQATTNDGGCRPPLNYPFAKIVEARKQLLIGIRDYESDSA